MEDENKNKVINFFHDIYKDLKDDEVLTITTMAGKSKKMQVRHFYAKDLDKMIEAGINAGEISNTYFNVNPLVPGIGEFARGKANQVSSVVTLWADYDVFHPVAHKEQNLPKDDAVVLRRFEGVSYIQLLIHPDQKRLIIRPSDKDAPDSLRWCTGGGEKEIKNRDMICRIFAAKLFDLMGWNNQYHYKMLGKPAVCDGEALFLFKLTDFELFVTNASKKRRSYLPADWRECFGPPVEDHEEAYKIDLADGYISSNQA